MNNPVLPISGLTLDAVQAEALIGSYLVKGDSPGARLSRIKGRVASIQGSCCEDSDRLVRKLLQLASLALLWVEDIEGS